MEIKFKVWDTYNKKFIDYWVCNRNDSLNSIFEEKRYIFLQFTGLPDKNKHEYYDGDYFKCRAIIKLIRYIPEKTAFCMANIDDLKIWGNYNIDIWTYIRQDWWNEFYNDIEYIGNIFETDLENII